MDEIEVLNVATQYCIVAIAMYHAGWVTNGMMKAGQVAGLRGVVKSFLGLSPLVFLWKNLVLYVRHGKKGASFLGFTRELAGCAALLFFLVLSEVVGGVPLAVYPIAYSVGGLAGSSVAFILWKTRRANLDNWLEGILKKHNLINY